MKERFFIGKWILKISYIVLRKDDKRDGNFIVFYRESEFQQ